jgi:hypothetical protein
MSDFAKSAFRARLAMESAHRLSRLRVGTEEKGGENPAFERRRQEKTPGFLAGRRFSMIGDSFFG